MAGLEEYARLHPITEERLKEITANNPATVREDTRATREEVERLKRCIASQLAQGAAPHAVLYTAIKAIGLLTNDAAWQQEQAGKLDAVFSDLEQQSIWNDNREAARERLEAQQTAYKDKTRRQLINQKNGLRRVLEALDKVEAELNLIDPPPTGTPL